MTNTYLCTCFLISTLLEPGPLTGTTTAGSSVTPDDISTVTAISPGSTDAVTQSSVPAVTLQATLEEPFVEQFNNRSSAEYRELEVEVVAVVGYILSS